MIADNREDGGRLVREEWVRWASSQTDPKPAWLVPWSKLPESDKEADRRIWDAIVAPYATVLAQMSETIFRQQAEIDRYRDEKLRRVLGEKREIA